jgi:hypothetical protein
MSHGHVAFNHGPLYMPCGPISCCVTSVPWTCNNGPWDILTTSTSIPWSFLFLCPFCTMDMLQWAMDTVTIQPLSHGPQCTPHGPLCCLSYGHVERVHGTLCQFHLCPMGHYPCHRVLSIICPMGMLQRPIGPFNCSISVPLATINLPWSCLLLCHICTMDMLQWIMGHSNTSTFIPWDIL